MNTPEPLKPAPRWVYTSGAGWHDSSALVTSSRIESPHSYVHGFEDGAYALARRLNEMLDEGEGAAASFVQIVRVLGAYRSGLAHPVRGWEHEPKRA